jgi:hypothetical protein
MKLIFNMNPISEIYKARQIPLGSTRCITNGGIQYCSCEDAPFKVGDFIRFTDEYRRQLGATGKGNTGRYKIKSVSLTRDHVDSSSHVILRVKLKNDITSVCCSWVIPQVHWKKL